MTRQHFSSRCLRDQCVREGRCGLQQFSDTFATVQTEQKTGNATNPPECGGFVGLLYARHSALEDQLLIPLPSR